MWYKSPRFSQQNVPLHIARWKWCRDNLEMGTWGYVSGVDTISYTFKNQEDFTWFMFVWYYNK